MLSFLAAPNCQLGSIGQALGPMNQARCWEEAGPHLCSCRAGPLRAQAPLGLLPLVTCVLASWPGCWGSPGLRWHLCGQLPLRAPLSGSLWRSVGGCSEKQEGTGKSTLGSLQPREVTLIPFANRATAAQDPLQPLLGTRCSK